LAGGRGRRESFFFFVAFKNLVLERGRKELALVFSFRFLALAVFSLSTPALPPHLSPPPTPPLLLSHDRCGAVGVGDLVKRPRRVCETRRPRLVAGRGLGRRRDDLPEPARDVPQERAGARGEAVPGKQGGPGQRRGESSKIFFGFFLSFVHLLFFFQEETRNDEIKISPSLLLSLPLSTSNSPLLSSLTRTINKTNQ
jgi:hypothetical protein